MFRKRYLTFTHKVFMKKVRNLLRRMNILRIGQSAPNHCKKSFEGVVFYRLATLPSAGTVCHCDDEGEPWFSR